ncbi:MAG: LemA family protein [Niabella sp.]
MTITSLIILGILVLLIIFAISMYNKLVKLKILVQEAWSSIDVMLKKRHDLIPSLVNTVKGYAQHEQETFTKVIEARNAAIAAKSVKDIENAENILTKAVSGLFALAEQYPDLKANTNFLQLQAELSNLESDIEKSRRYYNGTVRNNNTAVQTFPGNIFAGIFNFSKASFFELTDNREREVPEISF